MSENESDDPFESGKEHDRDRFRRCEREILIRGGLLEGDVKSVSEVLELLNDAVAEWEEERSKMALELRDSHEDEVDPMLQDRSVRRRRDSIHESLHEERADVVARRFRRLGILVSLGIR